MRIGRLRHRISIQRNAPTQDAAGADVEGWANLATVWGEILPLKTGDEKFASDQPFAEQFFSIRCRYSTSLSEVNSTDRVIHGTRIFDIERVEDVDGRQRYLLIYARVINPRIHFDSST